MTKTAVFQIKHWLAPPVFEENEEKSRRAKLLNISLIASGLLMLLILIGNLIGGRTPPSILVIDGLLLAVCFLLRVFLFRGKINQVAIGLIAFGLIANTAAVISLGTVRSPTTAGFLLLVLLAGLLFNLRGLISTIILASLAVFVSVIMEEKGLLRPADFSVNITQWFTYTSLFLLCGGFTYHSIRKVLDRLYEEVAERKAADQQLQQSERQYRELVQSAGSIVLKCDLNGHIIFINQFALDFFGFREGEILGKNISGTILPRTESTGRDLEATVRNILKNPDDFALSENENTRKNGERVWVSWANKGITDNEGNLIAMLSTGYDITQRKQFEKALKESEQRFRSLVETTSDWIWELDRNSVFTYASPKVKDLLGYEPVEILGKTPSDFMLPDDADPFSELFDKIVTAREPFSNLKNKNQKKNGDPRVLESSGVPIIGADGSLRGYRGISRDITERVEKEADLQKLWIAVEQIDSSIVITNRFGSIEYVNPGFCSTSGYSTEEAIGKNPRILQSDKHDSSFYEEMWRTISSGRIWRGEICNRKKNRDLFWEDSSIAPIIDESGHITHFVAVKKDITHKKELENLKEDIERIMRHDLKSPLNAIIGYPQLLINTDLTDRQEKFVRNIEQAGQTMLQIIELYLDMSKMEAGTYDLEPVPLDLIDILKGVLLDLEIHARTKQIQFDLTINQHPPTESDIISITGEKALCYAIFSNLIKNAVEASPENHPVKIDISPRSSTIDIEIINQGVVPEEIRERFFDKYVTLGKRNGTGIGTYSARLMTEISGGSIVMHTSERQGTRITVTIPG